MSIFAVADLHLSNDGRIDKPMDVFGAEWFEHDRRIAEDWKQRVSEEDTVIVAGDISWGLKLDEAEADLAWLEALPGQKLLVRGNHDLWWSSIKKMNELCEGKRIYFLQNDFFDTGEGVCVCGTRGWLCPGSDDFTEHDRKIYLRELLRLEMSLKAASAAGKKKIIGALHYPPTNEYGEPSGFTELFERYGVSQAVYGHLHGKSVWPRGIKGELRGVEYSLVSLDYLDCRLLEIEI